ncbi:MAG: carboxylating nicotinate-nucleotide diphosphorylase [Planctomycetota bacterium]
MAEAIQFDLDQFLLRGLEEDVGGGDVTSCALLAPTLRARGQLRLREQGVVAGLEAALRVFQLLDDSAEVRRLAEEGEEVGANGLVGEIRGSARAVLTGERLALNLLARLSGIATLTQTYVMAVEGTGVEIVDTRKTTPHLRFLEKHAVLMGGGVNHRFGLFDAVLVKDNHLDLIGASGSAAGMSRATRQARENAPEGMFIQVEAQTVEEAEAVVAAGADSVLFDNFSPAALKAAVIRVRAAAGGRPVMLEASGGINLKSVRAFAETGVDRLSIGALTHAARSLDVTLEIEADPSV